MIEGADLVDALRRQWFLIAERATALDLSAPSRVTGWRNAEVMAHLAIQPVLLSRFLQPGREDQRVAMPLHENLAGTRALAPHIDRAAREAAEQGRIDFAQAVDAVDAALRGANVTKIIITLQGPIRLADYLRTRCIEAVVHGKDLKPPVDPDPVALTVTVEALMMLLESESSALAAARALPPETFVDVATGRVAAPEPLAQVMPLMS